MNTFYIDKQTIEDLQLVGSGQGGQSVLGWFDQTVTDGGKDTLSELFAKPTTDIAVLTQRADTIRLLMDSQVTLEVDNTSLDFMEYYLGWPDKPRSFSAYSGVKSLIFHRLFPSAESYAKQRGIHEVLDTLAFVRQVCSRFDLGNTAAPIDELNTLSEQLLQDPFISGCMAARPKFLNGYKVEKIDFLFRKKYLNELKQMLRLIYTIDAYYSIANVAREHSLVFPVYSPATKQGVSLKGVFHPLLTKPVANDFSLDYSQHVCFVTGANMSGKSTLMKAVAIAVYLAHVGLPVPAASMEIGIFHGLLTTINLADNINEGYSHFYNEVKRIKLVAAKIKEHSPMLVIFDELFRGTNVKDAHDASLRIIQRFMKIKSNFFVVSTHITEVAKALEDNPHIAFRYLSTRFVGGKPTFDYRLYEGVTHDRIGMWILENEGVFQLLEQNTKSGLSNQ